MVLDGERGKPCVRKCSELECCRENVVGAVGSVDRDEDLLERHLCDLRFERASRRWRHWRDRPLTCLLALRLRVRVEEALGDRGRDDRREDNDGE